MSYPHDPLLDHDRQQAAQERGEAPLTLADLSPLEREALTLLRLHPRNLEMFADSFGSLPLRAHCKEVQASLLGKGVIFISQPLINFVALTAEGVRLQQDAQGGEAP